MWPEDMKAIFERVRNLNEEHGFAPNSRPFIYQEVIDLGKKHVLFFPNVLRRAITVAVPVTLHLQATSQSLTRNTWASGVSSTSATALR